MVEKMIPFQGDWPFSEQKNISLIRFCKTTYILHLLGLMCIIPISCMVYVTYIFAFIPTPFRAIPHGKRPKDRLNRLNNSVFTMERKCWNKLFHPLKQFVSQAKQIVSTHDTESMSVHWPLFRAFVGHRKRCFWIIFSRCRRV
jgi:hypothetical protein